MKRILLIAIAFFTLQTLVFAQDVWKNSVKEGFDHPLNLDIKTMHAFHGMLYAGTGSDSGYVYRSATGHVRTWEKVFQNGWSLSIENINSTTEGGGYLYMNSLEFNADRYTYRTNDGVTWTPYFHSFGYSMPFVFPFKGLGTVDSMYVIDDGMYGSSVHKSAFDSNDPMNGTGTAWTTPLNLDGLMANIFIKSYCYHNNKVYFGTDNAGWLMWHTADGNNFIFDTAAVIPTVTSITAMASYNGYLYVGTQSMTNGPQLFRTMNDTTFTLVAGFAGYNKVTSLDSVNGELWVTLENMPSSTGGKILWSSDGFTFTSSDSTGFGIQYEDGTNGNTAVFHNNLYYACTHNTGGNWAIFGDGGEMWRYCLGGPLPVVNLGADDTMCINTVIAMDAGVFSSYLWCSGDTTQSLIPYSFGNLDYYLIATDANGCSNSDTVNVTLFDNPGAALFSSSDSVLVCLGTSLNLTATDFDYPRDMLHIDGSGSYVKGRDYTSLMNGVDESMTIEMWFRPSDAGVILSEMDTPGGIWGNDQIYIDAAGNIFGRVAGLPVDTIGNVPLGSWNHLALRYDKAQLKLDGLLNGVSSGAFTSGDRVAPWESGYTQSYEIGLPSTNSIYGNHPYDGKVSDVRIWNYARTDLEISSNMNVIVPPNSPGLVADYIMNEATGDTIAHDHSINGLDDTVIIIPYTQTRFIRHLVYTWTPNIGLSTNFGDTVVVTPTATTTYTVSTNNYKGCMSYTPITIQVPNVQISPANSGACLNTPTNYSNSGYTTPDTYDWYLNGVPVSNSSSYSYTSPIAGSDIIMLVGYTGTCIDTTQSILTTHPVPSASVTAAQTTCYGDTLVLFDTVSGGTLPYTFAWTDGTNNYTTQSITIPALTTANFIATITDGNACAAIDTSALTVMPLTDIYGNVSYSGGPVTNGNAVLFHYLPYLTKFDSVQTVALSATGDYHFINVLHRDYLIKIFADSATYPALVPSFYGNKFLWDSAMVGHHDCSMAETLNVVMTEPIATVAGNGLLRGMIKEGVHYRHEGEPVRGIDVKVVHNPGGAMVAHTFTNMSGYYSFGNLDTGRYTIYVDVPGLHRDSVYTPRITAVDTAFVYLDYFVDSTSIYIDSLAGVGISNPEIAKQNKFALYPNPSDGHSTVEYSLNKDAMVSLFVYDVLGNRLKTLVNTKQQEGKYKYDLLSEGNKLKSGVYFITLIVDGKESCQRLVVMK